MSLKIKIDQILRPIANHPVPQALFQGTKKVLSEIVLLAASKALLEVAANQIALRQPLLRKDIWMTLAVAPFTEEIIFRGIIQEGIIHNCQRVMNYIAGRVSEEELKAQKLFRIHATAFLFGSAHATPFQWVKCYMTGTNYGYLKEKYNTLSISILAHGLNNAIVMITLASINEANRAIVVPLCLCAVASAQVFWYLLSRDYIALPSQDAIILKASQISRSVKNLFCPAPQLEEVIVL